MVKRGRGRPRSTPASRARTLRRRQARQLRLRFAGSHLRAVADAAAAQGPRRSLRIQYLADNPLLHQGVPPWYRLILFGEPGYFKDAEVPPDGYVIVVTHDIEEDIDENDGDY